MTALDAPAITDSERLERLERRIEVMAERVEEIHASVAAVVGAIRRTPGLSKLLDER